jgi:transcriptional regulator with XRE-family HTH domain
MKLKDFLKEEKITQEEFAKQIDTAQGCISRWCGGEIPRADMMTKILIATKGKVTANDFYYEGGIENGRASI